MESFSRTPDNRVVCRKSAWISARGADFRFVRPHSKIYMLDRASGRRYSSKENKLQRPYDYALPPRARGGGVLRQVTP